MCANRRNTYSSPPRVPIEVDVGDGEDLHAARECQSGDDDGDDDVDPNAEHHVEGPDLHLRVGRLKTRKMRRYPSFLVIFCTNLKMIFETAGSAAKFVLGWKTYKLEIFARKFSESAKPVLGFRSK